MHPKDSFKAKRTAKRREPTTDVAELALRPAPWTLSCLQFSSRIGHELSSQNTFVDGRNPAPLQTSHVLQPPRSQFNIGHLSQY